MVRKPGNEWRRGFGRNLGDIAWCRRGISQKIVDKTVATVSDGIRTELITLSDLKWQLALQPGTTLKPASSEDLNAALNRLIDQRIFALEAKRLPRNAAEKSEVSNAIKEIISRFPTANEFEARLREVGFTSVNDESFQAIIADRIAIEKYLAFRFRVVHRCHAEGRRDLLSRRLRPRFSPPLSGPSDADS
jgi:hypothetical protein